jgi:hypothetical protein
MLAAFIKDHLTIACIVLSNNKLDDQAASSINVVARGGKRGPFIRQAKLTESAVTNRLYVNNTSNTSRGFWTWNDYRTLQPTFSLDFLRREHLIYTSLNSIDQLIDLVRGDVERRRKQDMVPDYSVCRAFAKSRVDRDAVPKDGIVQSRSQRQSLREGAFGSTVFHELDREEQASSSDLSNIGMIT